jgi:hypothetical protein
MPVLPLTSILHPRFKDMNFLDEDDRNTAISGITAGSVGSDLLDKIIVVHLNGSKSLTTFSISSCSSKDRSILISIEGLLIETKTDTTVIKKMKKVTRENIRRRYERNQSENECVPVLPLASILHPRFMDRSGLSLATKLADQR